LKRGFYIMTSFIFMRRGAPSSRSKQAGQAGNIWYSVMK